MGIFLDIDFLFNKLIGAPIQTKHALLMHHAGVEFYDSDYRFVTKPVAAIIGIGGLPIRLINEKPTICGQPITIDILKQDLMILPGASASMSYMNPKDKTLPDLAEIVIKKHGHHSVLHTLYLNIAIFGISSAAEHELDCQRDLMHISRITVAKAKAQSRPSFVVLNKNHLPALTAIIKYTDQCIANLSEFDSADIESVNNFYPSLKAHSVILSGSVKNYIKLCEQIGDNGKEHEYREILKLIDALRNYLICTS